MNYRAYYCMSEYDESNITFKVSFPFSTFYVPSVENHYARTNRTFETSDLIPVAAWSAEDAVQIIPNKADIIRAAVVVMSAMIIILLILAICLLWKFRKSISEYCKVIFGGLFLAPPVQLFVGET